MTPTSNQIAFDTILAIMDAARSCTLTVAGTAVAVTVSRGAAAPWPADGVPGVAPQTSMPAPVLVDCAWQGGKVQLSLEPFLETSGRYRGDLCLMVRAPSRWLVVVNVKAAVDTAESGGAASLRALASVIKRNTPGQDALNEALRKLVKDSGLPRVGRRVELARVALTDGRVDGGAGGAFERAIHLALLKLDFSDYRHTRGRGRPLVDLASLGVQPDSLVPAVADGDEETTDEGEDAAVAKVRRKVEVAVPDPTDRAAAVALLADAIDNAHEEHPGGWVLQTRGNSVILQTARVYACRIRNGRIQLSVMGPVSPEVRAELGISEGADDGEWRAIRGGLWINFPAGKAQRAWELLRDPFDRFVDLAMARLGRRVQPGTHQPEVVTFVAEETGRDVPQPEFDAVEASAGADDDAGEEDEAVVSTEPVQRGRKPIFERSQRTVGTLIEDIKRGAIALPDLQRPFVWEDTKVRDLFDSLFVGYPTGTVVLWQVEQVRDAKMLGSGEAALRASSLVIDGQQRLTSLYAAIEGTEIVDRDGDRRRIKIAFRMRDGRFAVPDAAILQNPEYLADIREVWKGPRTPQQIRRDLVKALKDRGREVTDDYQDAVEHNLQRLADILGFEFPVIEIRRGEADDEQVADIFVRINNQGKRLGQGEFVLTLLSVFHGALRDRLEARAAEISRESIVAVEPDLLVRAACGVAFERARMAAIYKFLRGVDPDTGDTDPTKRQARLHRLDESADDCLDPTIWRDYEKRVRLAGFVSKALVGSTAAVVNSYAFYVKGRRAGGDDHDLGPFISRWVFATLLTARYSASAETMFEADLSRLRDIGEGGADRFIRALDELLDDVLTSDYWTRTLVSALATQKSRAPSALAFRAAQVVLGARALFSDASLQTMLADGPSANRAATELHHLFPKAWLQRKGVTDRREINQVANLADVGWSDNSDIGATGPDRYVPRLRERLKLDDARWGRMCAEHALPPKWEEMPYDEFLEARRRRMAEIIRVAYRKLGGDEEAETVAPPWFLPGAELVWTRIAETERALRALVRTVYVHRYGDAAASRIEAALPPPEREAMARALRSRPAGADPLTVVDYLYLKQLPALLFANDVWGDAKARLGNAGDLKPRLAVAIDSIAPVRNEIAHVREVSTDRLAKASVACTDVLALLKV